MDTDIEIEGIIRKEEINERESQILKFVKKTQVIENESHGSYVNKQWSFSKARLVGTASIVANHPYFHFDQAVLYINFRDILRKKEIKFVAKIKKYLFKNIENRWMGICSKKETLIDLSGILNPDFINYFKLNDCRMDIRTGHIRLQILNEPFNQRSISVGEYVSGKVFKKLNKKEIIKKYDETKSILDNLTSIFILSFEAQNYNKKAKPEIREELRETDILWCMSDGLLKGNYRLPRDGADVSDLFTEEFLNTTRGVNEMWLMKDNWGCIIQVSNHKDRNDIDNIDISMAIKYDSVVNRQKITRGINVIYNLIRRH